MSQHDVVRTGAIIFFPPMRRACERVTKERSEKKVRKWPLACADVLTHEAEARYRKEPGKDMMDVYRTLNGGCAEKE